MLCVRTYSMTRYRAYRMDFAYILLLYYFNTYIVCKHRIIITIILYDNCLTHVSVSPLLSDSNQLQAMY